MPGSFRGKDVTIQDVFEAVGACAAGRIDRGRAARRWRTSPARARAPAAASSPPTRWRWRARCSGCRRWASTTCPRSIRARVDAAARARRDRHGRCVARGSAPAQDPDARGVRQRHHRRRRDRRLDQRRAAPAGDRARGRRAADASTTSTRIAAQTPMLADLKPGGRYIARRYRSGGRHAPGGASGWSRRGCCEDEHDRQRPHASLEEAADAEETPGQQVVRPLDQPLKPRGGFAILRGIAGARGLRGQAGGPRPPQAHRPGARVRLARRTCFAAVQARARSRPGDVVVIRYEGPKGGPGHARDAGA